MRHPVYLSVLLVPVVIMAGCSTGHESHEDGEGDHHDTGIGEPGDVSSVDRVISVVMDDTMKFIPDSFEVVAGETIQFDILNQGKLVHEFVLGSAEEIKEHHELMQKYPGMEHDEPNSVSLETKGTGTVIWSFTSTGVVDIACLKPGHLEAGMKGSVAVSSM